MSILGTHCYVKERRDRFKCQRNVHNVLCCCDYEDRLVSSFDHQIKPDYYGGDRYVYTEGIDLENFSISHHPSPFLASDDVS